MASLRASNIISRWHGLKASMSRLNSTKAPHVSAPGGTLITAFESVMQDLYGDQWKEKLSRDGRRFVYRKERGREKKRLKVGGVPVTPNNHDAAVWHRRVQKIKARILQKGNDARVTPEAIAEAQKSPFSISSPRKTIMEDSCRGAMSAEPTQLLCGPAPDDKGGFQCSTKTT